MTATYVEILEEKLGEPMQEGWELTQELHLCPDDPEIQAQLKRVDREFDRVSAQLDKLTQ